MRRIEMFALGAVVASVVASAPPALAQTTEPASRQAAIELAQAEKSKSLHPFVVSRGERLMDKADSILNGTTRKWHPFFESAYSGGGFALGAGYAQYVTP